MTCTASYTITQADLDFGSVKNTAKASANGTDSNEDDETVTAVQNPHINLTKTTATTSYDHVGQVINYTMVATNDGNVTLYDVSIVDPKLGALTCAQPTTLAPGASLTCTGSHTVTQADLDAGNYNNTATVSGKGPQDQPVSATASASVPAVQNPALSLIKSAGPATYDHTGQTISYTYVLKNTGNVTLSGPFTVTDNKVTVTCPSTPTTLAPNASLTCTANYNITQADLDNGSVTNIAKGRAYFGTTPVDSNEATTTVTAVQKPSISIVKKTNGQDANTAPGVLIPVGGAVTWTYNVTNTGNVTLTAVSVTDDKGVTVTCPNASLAPTATMQCTAAGTAIAGQYTNKGTVTGKPPVGTNVTANDPSNYYGVKDLTITKTAVPTFKRTFLWSISKNVDKTLVKQVSGSAVFNYTVNVSETGFTDSLWTVTGQITVTNPNTALAISGVTIADAINNGGICSVTSGSNVTIPANSSKNFNYACTYASKPTSYSGVNTATAAWDKNANFTPNGSASGTKSFTFDTGTCGNPTNVNKTVTVTDTFNGTTTTLGTVTATTTIPYTSRTFSYSRSIAVPSSCQGSSGNCKSYTNTAKIVETGQTASKTVTVCGPIKTGALTIGYWQNKNGQSIIKGTSSVNGVCKLTPWLRGFTPFQDLSATASCSTVATYVYNIIKAANSSGAAMNAMLKAQMLATALDVYFSNPALGGNKIGAPAPIGGVTVDLTWVKAGTGYQNVSGAFGGAISLTVSQMLAYAASQSNLGGSMWYANVKTTQEKAKNAFDAINNSWVFAP